MHTTIRTRRFVSPCRVSDGPRRHRCSRAHADLVQGYRDAVAAQYERAEMYSYGYKTELSEFYSQVEEKITFKRWLIMNKGMYAQQSDYAEVA